MNQSKLRLIDAETVKLADFALFWEIYPRKCAKLDAEKAWQQTKTARPCIEAIIAAVQQKLRSGEWRDAQFIPYPATWLRRGQWSDE